ncbi:asparagine synthase-related protein [Alkalihalobacillus sp. MEB130]|uniref:asparagine synthase-related protein n=1 Tax=Alkalihalobacillus sp. MEB130 TaxID=2976704 RepID=UPI0028DE0158|nr:asparagine synthase-related protein [Alkalihalobacillus sp. MEB130]MDT8861085.1 asparagine synthase-related protein [Alkalihalobacillus sp. MEB130]
MSAIVGIYNFKKEPINNNNSMDLMKSLQRFPADNVNTLQQDNIFLGCHAQWITPESINEKLPYYDYNTQLAITADAILDNRKELFDMLQVNNQDRSAMPDSQLILLAYQNWGEDVPKYLIGDFAFVIWDEKNQVLFAARDFSGARTLYYYRDQNHFAFSTTIEPLFTLPYVPKRLNEEWLAEFLTLPGMIEAVDMNATVYQAINQIPPSHSITVINNKVQVKRYCVIDFEETLMFKSNEEYEEAFKETFQKAVNCRLRANGEVGSQLSGGLDSGAVVGFAAKELKRQNKKLHTFSYIPKEGFKDWTPHYYLPDERPFIKQTVNHVGNIQDNYLSFENRNSLTEIDELLEIMEMPYKFFENSFWLKGISEIASERGIKVLLNGARGNHSISFGSWNLTMNYYTTLLKKLRWIQLYNQLGLYCNNFKTGKSVMVPVILKKAFPQINQLIERQATYNYQPPSLISPSLAKKTDIYERLKDYGVNLAGNSTMSEYEFRDKHFSQLFSWNKAGTIGTKLSLKYGVWDRDPTNDLRVIRFCLSIPKEQYVVGGLERSLIRRATKGIIPNKVRLNQKFRGLQSADMIYRIAPHWSSFIYELKQLTEDPMLSELIDIKTVKRALKNVGGEPKPEYLFDEEFRMLTRSLIVYRFVRKLI